MHSVTQQGRDHIVMIRSTDRSVQRSFGTWLKPKESLRTVATLDERRFLVGDPGRFSVGIPPIQD